MLSGEPMKRKHTLYLFISSIILTGSVVFASPDRSGFWNERVTRLAKEGERFSREGFSSDLQNFIAGEKERCNAMAEIFARKETNPEFLTENPAKISDDQINHISKRYALSYSRVHLLRTIIDSSFSKSGEHAVTESLAASVSRIFSSKEINPDKKYIASFIHGLNPREIKTIAAEYAIESFFAAQENSLESDAQKIASLIRSDLDARSFMATNLWLNEDAARNAAKYFSKKAPEISRDNVASMAHAGNSDLARTILDRAQRTSSELAQIHEYMGIAAPTDASSLSGFILKQGELEKSALSR